MGEDEMAGAVITRDDIRAALRSALEPLDYVNAMWEGGAAAFDRVDEWSDIDLQVDADDDRIADVVAAAERALGSLGRGIELRYEIPQPTWHGHWQAFYRLADASPYLLIDFVVIAHGNPNKFLEQAIHGNALVHFDKIGVVRPVPLDAGAHDARLRERVRSLRITTDIFRIMTFKELNRGNNIEAVSFYHGFVLRPLIELLRIRHAPSRYNFHTRYIYYDLPRDVVARLEPFFFVATPDDLRRRCEEAMGWMEETFEGMKYEQWSMNNE